MNTYEVLLAVSIVFIVLGVILGIATIASFYKRNMAEVYDSLYNRGYTERIEKRRKRKENKRKGTDSTSYTKISTDMADTPSSTQSVGSVQPSYNSANSGMTTPLDNLSNSGMTMPLNNSANDDMTTPLNATDSGMTTLLETQAVNEDFKVVKELHYAQSKETI